MTASPGSSPESPKNDQGMKSMMVKGLIGAVSLAGTTAIPLVVNKYLSSPTPAASPAASTVPAQVVPSPSAPSPSAPSSSAPSPSPSPVAPAQVAPAQVQPDNQPLLTQTEQVEDSKGKRGKKRGKDKD